MLGYRDASAGGIVNWLLTRWRAEASLLELELEAEPRTKYSNFRDFRLGDVEGFTRPRRLRQGGGSRAFSIFPAVDSSGMALELAARKAA